jgi:hypothetical protein
MNASVVYTGLDVHKDSIVIAFAREGRNAAQTWKAIPHDGVRLRKALKMLLHDGETLKVSYEAGATGFGLCRRLREAGIDCIFASNGKRRTAFQGRRLAKRGIAAARDGSGEPSYERAMSARSLAKRRRWESNPLQIGLQPIALPSGSSVKRPRQESNLVFEFRRLACDPAHSKDMDQAPRRGIEPRLAV